MKLHLPAGSAAAGDDPLLVTPESAGWDRCGLRVVRLPAGGSRTLASGERGDRRAAAGGRRLHRRGRGAPLRAGGPRERVRARERLGVRPDRRRGAPVTRPAGCELALASARATRRFDPAYVEAGDVPVELRGAGQSTRQLNNFMVPEVFDGADKLICCELLTPDGNWSSYPPHKHDATPECEVDNEEIYYFRVGRVGTTDYSPEGFAVHRTYTDDGSIDETAIVRDGDVFLVPRRLPRPVHRGARLPALLPQRDGVATPARASSRSSTTRRITGSARPGTAWQLDAASAHDLGNRRRGEVDMRTVRLTTAQAIVRFLTAQRTLVDGEERAAVRRRVRRSSATATCTCLGEALHDARDELPTYRGQNEQGMALAAIGLREGDAPAPDHGRDLLDRPGRHEHGHGRGRRARRTGCRCCCSRATRSSRASPTRCCSRSSTSTRRRPRSTTRSAPVDALLGSHHEPGAGRAVAAARGRDDARPGRLRPGLHRAAAGRPGRGVRLPGAVVRAGRARGAPSTARPACSSQRPSRRCAAPSAR